jgi:hypothetical protein
VEFWAELMGSASDRLQVTNHKVECAECYTTKRSIRGLIKTLILLKIHLHQKGQVTVQLLSYTGTMRAERFIKAVR